MIDRFLNHLLNRDKALRQQFLSRAAIFIAVMALLTALVYRYLIVTPRTEWVPGAMIAVTVVAVVSSILARHEQIVLGTSLLIGAILITMFVRSTPEDFVDHSMAGVLITPITITSFIFGIEVAFALSLLSVFGLIIAAILSNTANSIFLGSNISTVVTAFGLIWIIHRLMAQLHIANKQLTESIEREQRIHAFMYFFQHELNSYAVGLKTTMEYFQQTFASVPMDDQSRKVLALTSTNVEKLRKLAHELVVLSREGVLPHQWQATDLRTLLYQAKTDSEVAYQQQSIPITIAAPADLVVQVEPTYLLLAIGTALRNALEALAHKPQQREHPRISLSAMVQDQRVVIRVEDSGPGFPAHTLSAIERAARPGSPPMLFGWSTKPAGVGLGLVLIIQVAYLHGGQATFGNTATGAYVTFDVPLAPAEASASVATLATSD